MTREEEKLKAADEYLHKRIYEEDCGATGEVYPVFIEGIEWADDHPRKGMVDIEKVCKYLSDKQVGFILTYADIKELCKAMEE